MNARLFILTVLAVTLTASASLLGSSSNLGVTVIPTDKLKDAPAQSGLLIATVVPDSPAANLDLKAGDVILQLNDKDASVAELTAIDESPTNRFNFNARVWSDGSTRNISYSIADGAISASASDSSETTSTKAESHTRSTHVRKEEAPAAAKQPSGPKPWLGIHIHNDDSGVRISTVVPNSPAADAGLKPGDLLESIDGKAVGDVRDVLSAVSKGEPVSLAVNRSGELIELEATLGKRPANIEQLPPIQDAREWLRQLPKPPQLESFIPPVGDPSVDALWEELGRLRGEIERLRRDLHQPHRRR
ncbi:MAG: S1-C subfamily serine protease [Rhodothermales bacterium]